MSTDFNASFSLFNAKEKKSERSPDMSGSVEIPQADIPALKAWLDSAEVETNWKDEPVVKLRIAGWNAQSKGGLNYINGKMSPPMAQAAPTVTTDDAPF